MKYSIMESFYSNNAGRFVPSPKVENCESTWHDFCSDLEAFSKIKIESKASAPLISPAHYQFIPKRKNENVTSWGFLALDFDGEPLFDEGEELDFELQTAFIESYHNFQYCAYTTASSRVGHDKYRVFIPFSRPVQMDEMKDVWAGGFELFDQETDAQCKDLSRGYYIPGTYPNANTKFKYRLEGVPIDPEDLIKLAPPTITPKIIPFVQSKKKYNWTDCSDCLFVKQEWVSEFLLRGHEGDYKELYVLMIRIAGEAKTYGHPLQAQELFNLVNPLRVRKDRKVITEAVNAIKHVYGCVV